MHFCARDDIRALVSITCWKWLPRKFFCFSTLFEQLEPQQKRFDRNIVPFLLSMRPMNKWNSWFLQSTCVLESCSGFLHLHIFSRSLPRIGFHCWALVWNLRKNLPCSSFTSTNRKYPVKDPRPVTLVEVDFFPKGSCNPQDFGTRIIPRYSCFLVS